MAEDETEDAGDLMRSLKLVRSSFSSCCRGDGPISRTLNWLLVAREVDLGGLVGVVTSAFLALESQSIGLFGGAWSSTALPWARMLPIDISLKVLKVGLSIRS